MAVVSGTFSSRSQYDLVLTVVQSSQNIASNYSTVSISLRIDESPNWGSWSNSALTWSWNVGGQTASGSTTYDFRNYDTLLLSSTSRNIAHNSDGTKSISFSASAGGGTTIGSASCSGSMGLTTIPRASTPSITGGTTLEPGAAVTIQTNRASTAFTHTLQYNVGTTGWVTIATGVGTSTSWTPPMSLLNQYPNATTGAGTLRCITYSGSTNVGTKDISFTLTTPASVVPTWSSVSVSENNALVTTHVGAYVQNVSKLDYAISGAAGAYGSSITIRRFTASGQTMNGASGTTPLPISQSGTVPVTWLIQDSRGRQKTQNQNITVLAYQTPKINSYNAVRALSDGTPSPEAGTYLRVTLNASVQSLVNSTQRNTIQIRIRTREVGSALAWTDAATLKQTINPGGISYNSGVTITGPYAIDTSYEVRVEVIDRFNTASSQKTLPVAAVFMHWDVDGLGVGKYRENGRLDVNGDTYSTRLRLTSTSDASLASTAHAFQVGFDSGANIIIDNNEIMARNNGAASSLSLNIDGGNITLGDADSTISIPGTMSGMNATETARGIAEIATQAETNTGTDNTRMITPARLRNSANLPYASAAGRLNPAASGYTTVTFPAGRFTQTPRIITGNGSQSSVGVARVVSESDTSFGIGIWSLGGAQIAGTGVDWVAIQMTSSSGSG